MMHPSTELKFINADIGFGVFATEFLPAGTITYVQDSLDISLDENRYRQIVPPLKQSVDRYAFIDQKGNRVLCWDHAKYVNHCCHANTISTGYGFEIAIRDIAAGEQITDDYGMFNLTSGMEVVCDRPDCRKYISRDDVARYHAVWDAKIKESLKFMDKVPQALLPFLGGGIKEQVFSYIAGKSAYVSVLDAQYQREASV
jgi:hypothetical protein